MPVDTVDKLLLNDLENRLLKKSDTLSISYEHI